VADNKLENMPSYRHEVQPITDRLFGPVGAKLEMEYVRQQLNDLYHLSAPPHDSRFSYEESLWEEMLQWAKHAVEP
jgi:hypothetical protein